MRASAEAAASRARSTADRLVELKVRLERLERGEPATADDVRRARQLAMAQVQSLAMARDRLLLTNRSALAQYQGDRYDRRSGRVRLEDTDHARDVPSPRTQPTERRPAGAGVGAPAWLTTARPSDSGAASPRQIASVDSTEEITRLRQGVAALLSWAEARDLHEVDRRQSWCRAVVEHCGSPGWRGWIDAACLVGPTVFSDTVRGVAITVTSASGGELAAASDRWTYAVQGLEEILGEGPSRTANAENRLVVVNDLASERQAWQGFASASAGYEVRGICALPLQARGVRLGTLTLYYRTSLTESMARDLTDATAFAGVAAAAVLADIEQIRHGRPADPERFTVHVAIGALAARLNISPDEAESRLRAFAFSADLTLEEAAQRALADRALLT